MIFFAKRQTPSFVYVLAAMLFMTSFTSCQKNYTAASDNSSNDASLKSLLKTPSTSAAVQTARSGVIVSGHIHGFYEYLPKGYSNDTKLRPLLICLHGIGQVGNGTTDLPSLLNYGPAGLINSGTFPASFNVDSQSFTMLIITPQMTDAGVYPLDIDSLIEYCKSHYRVDTNRVYLAGLSIGGANVWHYAGFSAATAAKITAMVPICSWTTPDLGYQVTHQEAQTIASAKIKIWQTHNYNDPTAMFAWSIAQEDMVDSALPMSEPLTKLTCFNSDSHDAWTNTYDPNFKESGLNIYQWMLHYAKNVTSIPITAKVPYTQVVTLKASNNLYVHNNGDGSPLHINSPAFSLWEGFLVVSVNSGTTKVALQNQNSYISIVNPNAVACTASTVGTHETFTWVYNSDATVSFLTNNGRYLSNIDGTMTCNATTIGVNEKFLINR